MGPRYRAGAEKKRKGRGGRGGNETRPNRRRIGNRTRGGDRGRGTAVSLYYQRCFHGQVHLRAPTRGPSRKKGPGIIHYDSSFRNNNEAYAAPRPPRHEFYVWKRETRKQGNLSPSLSLANPDHLDFHPVMYRVRRGRRTCDDSRISAGSSSAVVAIDDSFNEFHQPVFTGL